jgi:hypothetical protein
MRFVFSSVFPDLCFACRGLSKLNAFGVIFLFRMGARSDGVILFRPFSPSPVYPFSPSPSPSPSIASLHWGLEHIQSVRIARNTQDSIRILPNEARSAIGGLRTHHRITVGADLRVCPYKTGRTHRCAPTTSPLPLSSPTPTLPSREGENPLNGLILLFGGMAQSDGVVFI